MSETLFTTTEGENTKEEYVAKVVGAKGENWKDPEVIAKGYLTAQEHIIKLEAENATLKESATKQTTMDDILKEIRAKKDEPAGGSSTSNTTSATDTQHQSISAEDIKGLVKEVITNEEQVRTADANIKETKRQLDELFGTEAGNQLKKRAGELGMSEDRMNALAAESPTAFMALMGQAPKKETNQQTTSTVNVNVNASDGERNWAYYSKLRKENPQGYRSLTVQNQMVEDLEKMGDKFWG